MLRVLACAEDARNLGAGEELGNALRLLRDRDRHIEVRPPEHVQVEEANPVEVEPAARPGEFALEREVFEERLHLRHTQLIGRTVVELRDLAHRREVAVMRAHREATLAHGLDHLFT